MCRETSTYRVIQTILSDGYLDILDQVMATLCYLKPIGGALYLSEISYNLPLAAYMARNTH